MAIIKCRFSVPYCEYHQRHEPIEHDEYWWCDDNEYCPVGEYTRSSTDYSFINPVCKYCKEEYGEFEKTVKSYEFNGDLKIGKKTYNRYDIEYLEIDGRVLVGGEVC